MDREERTSKKVMVIAPHLDDEVLGCGATIMRHVQKGDEICVCFIAHRVYDHIYNQEKMDVEIEHSKQAKKILGYNQQHFLNLPDERLDNCLQDIIIPLEDYIYDVKPDIVYSPFIFDNNQDHRATAQAVQVVIRPASSQFVYRWLMYETPSATEQAPYAGTPSFKPTVYINIEEQIKMKIEALSCYETELRKYPHPRSAEGIKALAMKRGMEAGMAFAEALMLLRERNE